MITFNHLGYMGRLGNQMFQYATLLGVADKINSSYGIPISKNKKIVKNGCFDKFANKWIPYKLDLTEGFNLNIEDSSSVTSNKEFKEKYHHFDSSIFKIDDNTDLNGYFQTEKYFLHIKEKIKKEFEFKEHIKNEALKLKSNSSDTVSIHFRRGDYLGASDLYTNLDLDYYQIAINYFNDKDYVFYIFSDDINWCKEIFGESERISYIETNDQFIDLCLMSMCEHNIIANSSFSWWGAWLNINPDKKVIAPKVWFGPGLIHLQSDDLYCENWILL